MQEEEIKRWKVYWHVNKTNNKKYIGITSKKNVERRWNGGLGYINNTYFNRAIQKYGWDGFEHEVLFENLSEDEAKLKEIELIKKYDTMNSSNGYNMTFGGDGTVGYKHTKETKEKLSKLKIGTKMSEETKRKISKNNKSKSGKDSPTYGRKVPKEELERRIKSQYVEVVQLTKNGEFIKYWNGIKNAGMECGVNISLITQCCKGNKKIIGGYIWMYRKEYDSLSKEELIEKINKINIHSACIKVVQLGIEDGYINVWNSAHEAERSGKYSACCITSCCKGKIKTHKGYKWMYYDEYLKQNNFIDK